MAKGLSTAQDTPPRKVDTRPGDVRYSQANLWHVSCSRPRLGKGDERMTATNERTSDSRPARRSPWIVLVDAVLPVVLVFWVLVDSGTSVLAGLAHHA